MTRQTNQLPLFEENAVANATVKITKAGDGLSAALKVRPEALQLGEDVYYVLAARVGKIAHVDNDGVVTREHTVVTQAITAIDPTIAQKAIQSAAEETERLRAEQAGQTSLDDAGAEVVEAEVVADGVDTADPVASTVEASTDGKPVTDLFRRPGKAAK